MASAGTALSSPDSYRLKKMPQHRKLLRGEKTAGNNNNNSLRRLYQHRMRRTPSLAREAEVRLQRSRGKRSHLSSGLGRRRKVTRTTAALCRVLHGVHLRVLCIYRIFLIFKWSSFVHTEGLYSSMGDVGL